MKGSENVLLSGQLEIKSWKGSSKIPSFPKRLWRKKDGPKWFLKKFYFSVIFDLFDYYEKNPYEKAKLHNEVHNDVHNNIY